MMKNNQDQKSKAKDNQVKSCKGYLKIGLGLLAFCLLIPRVYGVVKDARQIENELLITQSSIADISILDRQEEIKFEDAEFATVFGKKIMRIKISHNGPNGFKLAIYSGNGGFKIASSYDLSLATPELPGTSIDYSFSMVSTSLGFLGVDLPVNLSHLPMSKVPTFIFFDTGVRNATIDKQFDFYIKCDPNKIKALLTKQGEAYFDKIYLVISDAL